MTPLQPAPSHPIIRNPLNVGLMLVIVTEISPDFDAVNGCVPGIPPGWTMAMKVSVWLVEGLLTPPQADAASATSAIATNRKNRVCIDVLSQAAPGHMPLL